MVKPYNSHGKYGLEVGVMAPSFELEEVEGGRMDLKKFLKKQPVLLNFFRGHF